MSFIRIAFCKLTLIFFILIGMPVLADSHDKEKKTSISKEEPLPLNDPFVGDSSFSGGVQVITSGEGADKERKKIDLFTYKLVGIIKSKERSFISLINPDGETINLAMFEELNDGVKLVDMNQNEAIFQSEDSYLIMNFKNQIKETNEY